MSKVKCPYCNSKNISYFRENIITKYYKVKRNGELYKTAYKSRWDDYGCCNYICDDCGEIIETGEIIKTLE